MESSLHLSAYPLAGCSPTTRTRFPADTVEVGIDGTFIRGVPFASGRSPAELMLPERRTSPFGAAFAGQPRRRRGGGLRALTLHSDPHAFKAGTCMTRLGCASLLRSTSLRSRPVLRDLVQDHQEALRLSRSLDCGYPCCDHLLPAVHYQYDIRTIASGANPSSPRRPSSPHPDCPWVQPIRSQHGMPVVHGALCARSPKLLPSSLEGSAIGRQL